MGQVPKYAIIGGGKVAKHLSHYFQLAGIPFESWNRNLRVSADEVLVISSHILLAISDDALENFYSRHPILKNKIVVHFSGNFSHEEMVSHHPLATFGATLFNLEDYKLIPFVCEKKGDGLSFEKYSFKEVFPQLTNKNFEIPESNKSLYHAFCVMSGNFTQILWKSIGVEFENSVGLPREILQMYMRQTFENIVNEKDHTLTGPWVRGDVGTIRDHLEALKGHSHLRIYQAFLELYFNSNFDSSSVPVNSFSTKIEPALEEVSNENAEAKL